MGMAKNMFDALIVTFLLAILILMASGTPLGFISMAVFTPVGMVILYFLSLQELIFIRL